MLTISRAGAAVTTEVFACRRFLGCIWCRSHDGWEAERDDEWTGSNELEAGAAVMVGFALFTVLL
jgi:hypothetical protein